MRFAYLRFAYLRFAYLRFAYLRFVGLRFVGLRFVGLRFVGLRFVGSRLTVDKSSIDAPRIRDFPLKMGSIFISLIQDPGARMRSLAGGFDVGESQSTERKQAPAKP